MRRRLHQVRKRRHDDLRHIMSPEGSEMISSEWRFES
jgi:hypothetical protein